MVPRLAWRLLTGVRPRALWSLAWRFARPNMRAIRRYRRHRAAGGNRPAFLFLSLTTRCQYRCRGCWVDVGRTPAADFPVDQLHRLLDAAKAEGITFFGLLGGEPLCYPALWDVLEKHRDAYFLLFTNGAALDADAARRLARLGHVTPMVSVEGLGDAADARRGARDVTERAFAALDACREAGLFYGAATSVCRTNLDDLASEAFLDALIRRGAHYAWYYIYRPAGADPAPALCLSREEIRRLRHFIVAMRAKKPIAVVDAYWDAEGRALCPAAEGVAYHVGPGGGVEPCPVVQFSTGNVAAAVPADAQAAPSSTLAEVFERSAMLRAFGEQAPGWTRGCPLMAAPGALAAFLREHGAVPTTVRDGYAELAALAPCACHDLGDEAIPDTHWLYRHLKKHWFYGFGAYG